MAYPLEGVRVLDFTRVLAGPFAGRMLSDLGAEVVKIEPPDGDVTRHFGRPINGLSGYYTQQNAGKRNVSIDLAKPGARDLMLALAEHADIVLENFRPGVMGKFGLGWDDFRGVNPRIIMLSISGFGQVGPERDRAAYAPIVHAEAGILERQASVDGTAPTDIALSVADTVSGLHGLVGVLAALRHVERTGEGQHIDMAMINALLGTDDYAHNILENSPIPTGGGKVWNATGGPVMIAGDLKWLWHNVRGQGVADPSPPDADLAAKIEARSAAIEGYLTSFADREALAAALDEMNLAWGDVIDHREVFDKQGSIEARGILTEVDDRAGGTRRIMQSPYKFTSAESGARGPAPYQGEHNTTVLGEWLNMPASDVADLEAEGTLYRENAPS